MKRAANTPPVFPVYTPPSVFVNGEFTEQIAASGFKSRSYDAISCMT